MYFFCNKSANETATSEVELIDADRPIDSWSTKKIKDYLKGLKLNPELKHNCILFVFLFVIEQRKYS